MGKNLRAELTKHEPINMLWVRGKLPWYAKASIGSFIHHGHPVHLYTYEASPDYPEGCLIYDASKILPASSIFEYRDGEFCGYLSGFANWFRYELLVQAAGWWADMDVICTAPFIGRDDYVFASGWEPKVPRYVNNNVIYVGQTNDPLMERCASECRKRGDRPVHAETGPVLLHHLVTEMELERYVTNPEVFNPIHYGDVTLLMRNSAYFSAVKYSRRLRGLRPVLLSTRTTGVHLYGAIFQKHFPDMNEYSLPKWTKLSKILLDNGSRW